MQHNKGFTLLELMVALLIVAIFAAIAVPSYQAYIRRASASAALQEMQKLAEQLARYKARNFNYRGFDPKYLYGQTTAMTSVDLPLGAVSSAVQYTLTLRDTSEATAKNLTSATALGQEWTIKATRSDNGTQSLNYNFLMSSTGLRCKTKNDISGYSNCGTTGSEAW